MLIENISAEDARTVLLEKISVCGTEEVSLEDSLDRILAEDYVSKTNIPNFRRSALDGFAINYEETESISDNPKKFRIHGYIGAGTLHEDGYEEDTAIKIMTGAPVPDGYDSVIKKEDIVEEDGFVYIPYKLKENANVVQIGEDIALGDIIAEKGEVINPGTIGVLASLGETKVKVFKKPLIGILNTGKEIVSLGQELKPGQIYNSNYFTIASILRKFGCTPINLGIATDDISKISDDIRKNIDDVDMIITTGGASVGDYDFIYDVYRELDAEILFKRVDMKPGTPMLSAYYKDKLLIGLSGNPGAAFISFDYIVTPIIKKIRGLKITDSKIVKAILQCDFNKKSPRRRLIRGYFEIYGDQNKVSIMKNQKSSALQSMTVCNCLIDVRPPSDGLKAGEVVEIILLEGRDIG